MNIRNIRFQSPSSIHRPPFGAITQESRRPNNESNLILNEYFERHNIHEYLGDHLQISIVYTGTVTVHDDYSTGTGLRL